MSDGREVVTTSGAVDHNCYHYDSSYNWCDFYRGSSSQSRRCCTTTGGAGYWMWVFLNWGSASAAQQANCAGTIAASWGTASVDCGAIGDACLSGPCS